jgi:hypothetical protein
MTLSNAAAARVRLIVWCKACHHQVEPDPAEMAERYCADTAVLDWRDRLVCSERAEAPESEEAIVWQCGCRHIDMVVSGTERR